MLSTMMNVPLSLNHLLERAGRYFGSVEVISRLPDKSTRTHTYAQIYRRTRALASALQRLGLKRGDRVATLCWNHHAHLECYFGIPAAGGVAHTLNLRLSARELGSIAADAKDRFLIIDDILLPLYRQFQAEHAFEKVIVFPYSGAAVSGEAIDYEALLESGDPDGFVYLEHDENDAVSMCYTSGTTGRAKGVVYSHRSSILHALIGCTADAWGLRNSDVLLPVTPMFHVNAWGIPYAAVMLGVKLVFPGPHLQPDDLLDLITSHRPTLSLGVPTIWMGMIQAYDAALARGDCRWQLPSGMRSLVGGAAVPEALIRAYAKHNVVLMQGWGMTETSPLASVSYLRPELVEKGEAERFKRAAMAGLPVPLVDLRIRCDDGRDAPMDGKTIGEIQCRGPFITAAYYGVQPTDDKFTADGWLRTGDVATMDEWGYIRITDRTKDLIKSGGEWISSVDLENSLMAHSAIAEAAVIAIPSEKWGERPLACVVLKAPHSPPTGLRQLLDAHLLQAGFAKWQLPDRYEQLDALPRTSTGKFYKLGLRQLFPQ